METSLLVTFFTAFLICFSLLVESSNGIDILSPSQPMSFSETLTSENGIFKLGFFSPGNSKNYYLGIWYARIPTQTIVWVANRDYPVRSNSTALSINTDGNMEIRDGMMSYVFTNYSAAGSNDTSAKLFDSGNLMLLANEFEVVWQSFGYPVNTLLPGMGLGYGATTYYSWTTLVSWRSAEDPDFGDFSLSSEMGPKYYSPKKLIITQGNSPYWEDEDYERWSLTIDSDHLTYISFNSSISQIVLEVSGQLTLQWWSDEAKKWESLRSSKCEYHACGAFSICNGSSVKPCECLPGFIPFFPKRWRNGETTDGCVRQTKLQCSNRSFPDEKEYGFLNLSNLSYPSDPLILKVDSAARCRIACLTNCSLNGYVFDKSKGCLVWDNDLFEIKALINGDVGAFYLKLPASESPKNVTTSNLNGIKMDQRNDRRQTLIVILLTISLGMITLGLLLLLYCTRRKFKRRGQNLLLFDLGRSPNDDDGVQLSEEDRKGTEREFKLPLFSIASVSAATDNFSQANKLGEGGFGPVYKGKLVRGGEVAVKRLSKRSGQGWEELKNEAMVIAKLQHKNLVRLLGCCVERDEKILIYEYMANKSLDCFLFDPTKRGILDWGRRLKIIDGVAQGLLYLHQYSRLRIIHRDLKASNILLDEDMNPKISDFGMARIFCGNELQANTSRIVGTYGYMSPEYALEGLFSVKSDVFSFGVLLLEIVSGKKNTGFYQTTSLNLLGYAWDLWISERALDLMDSAVKMESSITAEILLRHVHIALLCVQESAEDRPTMSDVVSMINNESAVLPPPKKPAFSNVRSLTNAKLAMSDKPDIIIHSHNSMSVSLLEAR